MHVNKLNTYGVQICALCDGELTPPSLTGLREGVQTEGVRERSDGRPEVRIRLAPGEEPLQE